MRFDEDRVEGFRGYAAGVDSAGLDDLEENEIRRLIERRIGWSGKSDAGEAEFEYDYDICFLKEQGRHLIEIREQDSWSLW